MARRARCGWVRSVLTQEVKAIAAARPRIDRCGLPEVDQRSNAVSRFNRPKRWMASLRFDAPWVRGHAF